MRSECGIPLIEDKNPPDYEVLKKNKVNLSKEEREKVKAKKAEWSDGRSSIFKSTVNGKNWFVTHTHRAYRVKPTINGAASEFHNYIKFTA
jgi:hypothetical protein